MSEIRPDSIIQRGRAQFAAGFHLGRWCTFAGSPPIEGKSQEVKNIGAGVAVPRPGKPDQPGLLLVQRQFVPGQPATQCFANAQGVPFVLAADHKVSQPREPPPRLLSEPSVNLSAHWAPIIQPSA